MLNLYLWYHPVTHSTVQIPAPEKLNYVSTEICVIFKNNNRQNVMKSNINLIDWILLRKTKDLAIVAYNRWGSKCPTRNQTKNDQPVYHDIIYIKYVRVGTMAQWVMMLITKPEFNPRIYMMEKELIANSCPLPPHICHGTCPHIYINAHK